MTSGGRVPKCSKKKVYKIYCTRPMMCEFCSEKRTSWCCPDDDNTTTTKPPTPPTTATLAKNQRPWWKVGSELMEVKIWLQGGEFQSVLKKRSTQYFVPGIRHASFAPKKCRHHDVRMSKNMQCVLIFPAKWKKQQINTTTPAAGTP